MAGVDPERVRLHEEAESRKRWVNAQGFVYPPPKQPAEYNKHPKAPSEKRVQVRALRGQRAARS